MLSTSDDSIGQLAETSNIHHKQYRIVLHSRLAILKLVKLVKN